jgi:hypothetical protein
MRSQLFRTDPVLVDGAAVVVALKDVDGAGPFTLYLENVDVAASVRTKWGSKNANLRFVAVADAGSGGNAVTVAVTIAPDQAYSAAVVGDAVTVNLRCGSDGRPDQTAAKVMDLLNGDGTVAAKVRTVLALGSDGSAVAADYRDIVDDDAAHTGSTTFALAGGADATTLGAVTVETSSLGHPDFAGPWVTVAAAGTALSTVAAQGVASYSFVDVGVRGLRVKASKGAYDTTVSLSAIVKKGGV